MRKQVKRWGNSLVISFSKEEERVNKIQPGDILDIKFIEDKRRFKK